MNAFVKLIVGATVLVAGWKGIDFANTHRRHSALMKKLPARLSDILDSDTTLSREHPEVSSAKWATATAHLIDCGMNDLGDTYSFAEDYRNAVISTYADYLTYDIDL
jgi:hypothetical protein